MAFVMRAKMTYPYGDVLGRGMDSRIALLLRGEQQARVAAAATAQQASRRSVTYLRPVVPRRAGRSSTGGKLASKVVWRASAGGSTVDLDVDALTTAAPHWIIEEIGTGQSATIMRAGTSNPRGRPAKGASYVKTVRSQLGRRISPTLAWGTGPSGVLTPPGARRGQGLYLRRSLTGRGVYRGRGMTITREVPAKHFVQAGPQAAFPEYRLSVRAAAQSAFGGHPYR